MINLTDLLLERDYSQIKSTALNIKNKLLGLKSKIVNKNLSTLKILHLFNKVTLPFSNIVFEIDALNNNISYPEEGIVEAWIDSKMIHIMVVDNFHVFITDPNTYQSIINVIHAMIIHELTHNHQLVKSKGNVKSSGNLYSAFSYLSNIHELQAHANGAMQELLNMGYTPNQIKIMLKDPNNRLQMNSDNSAPDPGESQEFWKYYDNIYANIFPRYTDVNGERVWKRFLLYCYQYLNEL